MSNKFKMSMQLPCMLNIETVAHCGLDKLGDIAGVNVDKIEEAKLLVNEAINNAIEHADSNNQQIRVEFSIDKDRLKIFVRDYGRGFDYQHIEDPRIENKIGGSHKRGWGLKLMQSLSDEFEIESDKHGTKIYMFINILNQEQ